MPDDGGAAPTAGAQDAGVLYGVIRDVADLQARMAAVERAEGETAQRTELRVNALAGQIAHLDERLDQQDAVAAGAQQQTKSQLGTVQQQLGILVAEKAAAQEARDEQRKTARATFRTLLLALPTATWPLTEGHPFALRAGIFGLCVGLAVAFIAHDHFRAPSAAGGPPTTATTR